MLTSGPHKETGMRAARSHALEPVCKSGFLGGFFMTQSVNYVVLNMFFWDFVRTQSGLCPHEMDWSH